MEPFEKIVFIFKDKKITQLAPISLQIINDLKIDMGFWNTLLEKVFTILGFSWDDYFDLESILHSFENKEDLEYFLIFLRVNKFIKIENKVKTKEIIINSDPINEIHVCYFTKTIGDKITLYEIVINEYEHPDSQGESTIPQYDIKDILTLNKTDKKAGALILMEANQSNIDLLIKEGILK